MSKHDSLDRIVNMTCLSLPWFVYTLHAEFRHKLESSIPIGSVYIDWINYGGAHFSHRPVDGGLNSELEAYRKALTYKRRIR